MNEKKNQIILSLIKKMTINYEKFKWGPKNQEELDLYLRMLSDLPESHLINAVDEIIKAEHYPPTIADIRRKTACLIIGETLDDGEALGELMLNISRYGRYDMHGQERLNPDVKKTVERMGGYGAVCDMSYDSLRKTFLHIFNQIKESRIKSVMLSDKKLLGGPNEKV